MKTPWLSCQSPFVCLLDTKSTWESRGKDGKRAVEETITFDVVSYKGADPRLLIGGSYWALGEVFILVLWV